MYVNLSFVNMLIIGNLGCSVLLLGVMVLNKQVGLCIWGRVYANIGHAAFIKFLSLSPSSNCQNKLCLWIAMVKLVISIKP